MALITGILAFIIAHPMEIAGAVVLVLAALALLLRSVAAVLDLIPGNQGEALLIKVAGGIDVVSAVIKKLLGVKAAPEVK